MLAHGLKCIENRLLQQLEMRMECYNLMLSPLMNLLQIIILNSIVQRTVINDSEMDSFFKSLNLPQVSTADREALSHKWKLRQLS